MSWYIEIQCFRPLCEEYFDWSGNSFSIKECIPLPNGLYIMPYYGFRKINIDFIRSILIYNSFENIKESINQIEILLSEEEIFLLSLYPEWAEYKKLGFIYEY